MANITGGTGNDILEGGAGPDHFDGGGGEDAVTYIHSPTGVNIYLINDGSPGPATGDAAGDTYHSIDDILYGDNRSGVQLIGLGGNDELHAGAGFTTFIGGAGADKMFAGAAGGLIDYEIATSGLTASLADPSINTGDAAGDQYFGPVHD